MIGRKRIPKSVRIVGLFWAVVMVVSLASTMASANTAQNVIDRSFGTIVTSSWTTPEAQKDTSSSCYVYNNSASNTDFKKVYVYGANVGSSWRDCTYGSARICYRGNGVTLPNLVNERGYNYAALTITYDANPYVVLKGYWQADR